MTALYTKWIKMCVWYIHALEEIDGESYYM